MDIISFELFETTYIISSHSDPGNPTPSKKNKRGAKTRKDEATHQNSPKTTKHAKIYQDEKHHLRPKHSKPPKSISKIHQKFQTTSNNTNIYQDKKKNQTPQNKQNPQKQTKKHQKHQTKQTQPRPPNQRLPP